ncbi:MAG: hypothetical protein A3G22_02285 [Alphaproteobacteria bacterium RIFCSPLOWO2_12_FULL_40_11]|nr:MAG: hypothetical protein A3G22_02285 [Alphaproteobacteria bacterium RIFCSPLOWO2_12_FULL_40_11]
MRITVAKIFLLVAIFLAPSTAISGAVSIKKIQFTGKNLLTISLSAKTNFKAFTLNDPPRLVVDIANATQLEQQPALPFFVKNFRQNPQHNSLRLVFDLTQKISLKNTHFDAKSTAITTEIIGIKEDVDFITQKAEEFEFETQKIANPDGSAKYVVKKIPKVVKQKTPVIVIDAGHGGKDPGTIGNFVRTKEKNLTLSYAKELGKQLLNTGRYKVYLTRDDDFFIPLHQRVKKARKKNADLFISLHANASDDRSTSGFSIYTLSEKSFDKQAESLAQRENRADIINGMNFADTSKDIMKTLIDLSQRESKNSSARFAAIAIRRIRNSEIEILQNTHRFAGFAVLTAPDMASVLIELGYLSNKGEEKLLNSIGYKRKVATSLVAAINEYFTKNRE